MDYIKRLRCHLIQLYSDEFITGSIYSGEGTITYFPFTPKALKAQKLKIAIVYNQPKQRFEIWLAAQNKQIQKKYWELFRESDWNIYHIPSSVEDGFSIVDDILVEQPDFSDWESLTEQIETKAMAFIKEILQVFE